MSKKPISSSSISSASEESKASDATQHLQQGEASVSSCPDITPEKISKAIAQVLMEEFREGLAYENRVIYEEEALILASLVIQRLNLS